MKELHDLITIDALPYYSFWHRDVEYAIWLWAEDVSAEIMYSVNLSKVIVVAGGHKPGNALATVSMTDLVMDSQGGFKVVVTEKFLPRVNNYLDSQDGEEVTFQDLEKSWDKSIYLVENGLEYVDGKIILKIRL